jgi:two-component system CheB/CheR fusion protein
MASADSQALDQVLELLRQSRGVDFGSYKRTSLARRIQRRMQTVGAADHAVYRDYLEVHPEEFPLLFNTILINVTGLFRDADAWEALAAEVLPRLIERSERSLRVWSAGCATGEEAYTLAILLAEALGPDEYRERVKIYATDADEEALNQARQAVYTERDVEAVPEGLRTKYFERAGNTLALNRELRRSVIFGRHDLLQDAPISRVDLLVCRNTLMYFNAEAQARVLARFHFALNEGGHLFLGKAESLLNHSASFTQVDLKRRIFVKEAGTSARARMGPIAISGAPTVPQAIDDVVRNAAFDELPVSHLVVNATGLLVHVNQTARLLFSLTPRDLGRPLQDLEVSYRPVELRSTIDRAHEERRNVVLKDVEWPDVDGSERYFDVQVVALRDPQGVRVGASISFSETTATRLLQQQRQRLNVALEATLEELQSTNEEMQTTNEELQSTVEELETTNEELHSSNEELETMNEELQSMNQELQTVYDESRRSSGEVSKLNTYLEGILRSLQSAVVAVDQDMHVQLWNSAAAELWGLREDEVSGKNFLNLDIGLPVERLRQPIRTCLVGDSETEQIQLTAINRRGRPVEILVTCSSLKSEKPGDHGVIMLMEERVAGAVDGDGARVRKAAR